MIENKELSLALMFDFQMQAMSMRKKRNLLYFRNTIFFVSTVALASAMKDFAAVTSASFFLLGTAVCHIMYMLLSAKCIKVTT